MIRKAKLGDRVKVQFVGLLKDGTTTQQGGGRQVLDFIVGSNEVIPGVSLGVVGMCKGEQKRMTLAPDRAFGEIRPNLVKQVPRERIPAHIDLRVGKKLVVVGRKSGRRRRVRVLELKPHAVLVDGNHPLAGKVLEVELQLVSLRAPSTDDDV
ncbi:MAG: FKBP-type peptidyl-prolyl cis-trans isomerase [Planctomycetia bacterium]|nr:FKBP-type peptidyl-prolyl cis-trans isomerase [Planctomycetia bacterium]